MARSTGDGIQKLGPGHYRVVVELGKTVDGKRRREHRTVRGTREEAKALRAQMLADKARGCYVGRSDQRLGDWLESWLAWKKPRVSSRTWERYCSLVRGSMKEQLGGLRLQGLTAHHLDEYYTRSLHEPGQRIGSTLSPTTVHHRHVLLKMALKRAVELDLLSRNPADFASPPRPARPTLRVLDEADSNRLLEAIADTPVSLAAYLALYSGARLGEILALRWVDLDLDGGTMRVRRTLLEPLRKRSEEAWYSFKSPKSGKERTIDLDSATVERLRQARRDQGERRLALGSAWVDLDLVITGPDGSPVRPTAVSTRFRDITRACGLEGLRFHDLRHSHASLLLKTGVPAHVVSQRLGHASVAFTLDVYASVLPGQQRAAAEAFAAAVAGGPGAP
jgi:integrase